MSLNVDALLFLDPLLLPHSRHPEMREAYDRFRDYFGTLVKVLQAIRTTEATDISFRTACRRLTFPEVPGTCLGYGAQSIRGSGVGPLMAARLARTGKSIVELGVDDPDLFLLLPLLEEDVGPDLISDMVTNVVLPELAALTTRVASSLGLPLETHRIQGREWNLPTNPTQARQLPLILVAMDVVRALPVALDWDDVGRVASENQSIRDTLNATVGGIWQRKTRESKSDIRRAMLGSKAPIEAYLEAVHRVTATPYDLNSDPAGEFVWRDLQPTIARDFPVEVPLASRATSLDDVHSVVRRIVDQFAHLVEQRGLWRELWQESGRPRREKSVQRLFFAVADSYCEAFNVDISPEVDTGSGEIDFKISSGYDARVVVEIKLSDNTRLIHGYRAQLEKYKAAERTGAGFYIVVVISDLGDKDSQLTRLKSAAAATGDPASELCFVDGMPRKSASAN